MRREPCAQHPWHARRDCRACLADHKAGEHRGRPTSDCPACRVHAHLLELRRDEAALDARRRAGNDHR